MVHLASISQQHYISNLIISWVSHHLQELNLEIQVICYYSWKSDLIQNCLRLHSTKMHPQEL